MTRFSASVTTFLRLIALVASLLFAHSAYAQSDCDFNGMPVSHMSSVTAYEQMTVPYGQNCISENRLCDDGTLTGGYQYSSCEVMPPSDCDFNGMPVSHGASVPSYEEMTVPYGHSCVWQDRTCNNGVLTNGYNYTSCEVMPPSDCDFNAMPVSHGASVTAYAYDVPPPGQACDYIERTCNNGVLGGSTNYTYSSCDGDPGVPEIPEMLLPAFMVGAAGAAVFMRKRRMRIEKDRKKPD